MLRTLLGVCIRGKRLSVGVSFVFGGQGYGEIVIAVEGRRLGRNCEVNPLEEG